MKLDPNNDVYPGDLGILNARKHKWAKGTNKGFGFKIASYVILAAGLVVIISVALRTQGAESSQLPVHLTIWTVAALLRLLFPAAASGCPRIRSTDFTMRGSRSATILSIMYISRE